MIEDVKEYISKVGEDAPSVYVGTYGKYNSGSLYGAWIDLTKCKDEDEFYEVCYELHNDEPRDSCELMFQDYECFPRRFYGESHMDFDALYEWLDLDEDERDIVSAYWNEVESGTDIEDILESYIGEYDSDEDYVRSEVLETSRIPDWLERYIDWDAYARDNMQDVHVAGNYYFRAY